MSERHPGTLRHMSPTAPAASISGADLDPRVARSRATVLDAATAILVEHGPTALTVDAVVARSGVARSTIYRHWATRDELLGDVFDHCTPIPAPPPADLGFEAAMRHFLHDLVRQFADPKWARLMPALMALKSYEPTMGEIEQRREAMERKVSHELFARGEREGLFGPELDRNQATALLVGPIVFALVSGEVAITEALADASLASFLAGVRAGASDVDVDAR